MKYDLASSNEELGIAGVSVVPVLSSVLERMIEQSRDYAGSQSQSLLSKFQSSSVPGISVLDYLQRVSSFAKCSDSCFIVALVYLDRLIETRRVALTVLNVHRLLITAVLLAAKMFEDEYFNNSFYARLGGVSVAELNALELELIKLIGFSTHVDVATFNRYFLEFWKLDPCCSGRPLPGFLFDPAPVGAAQLSPSPLLGSADAGGVLSFQTPAGCMVGSVAVAPQHAAPYVSAHAVAAAPVPRATRAIRFPMPPEYFPADAASYAQGIQGPSCPPAGYTYGNGYAVAPPQPGQPLKVQTDYSPYGAVNYGMGYARNDVSDFGAALRTASPHSVSSKMSPFERRTEEV